MLRDNVFLIGFDADGFPGNRREDPVLLDEERINLSDWLPLGKERPNDNYHLISELLEDIRGKVVISYACFDTTEHKEKFPSSLILQVYREITGDSTADYTKLQNYLLPPEGVVPEKEHEVMDEIDWWLSRYNSMGSDIDFNHVADCYSHFKQGFNAITNRLSHEFTVYDGNVSVKRESIDPREIKGKAISPTRLEQLGKCPYGYFLNKVLGIEPPEDMEFDPGKWLDPLTRGTLLHSIYENFYRELTTSGEKPQASKHSEYLTEMAEEFISKQVEELPPPSDLVYQYEKEELLNSLMVFLRSEEEYYDSSKPIYFELSFGPGGDGKKKLDMVPLKLPSGKELCLAGKIDRVDVDKDGRYLAYDYKTGSTYNYSDRKYYQGGRQLQHALYALALEKILQEKYPDEEIKVIGAGYLFPTVKGEGARYVRYYQDEDREKFLELLENLLELMAQGNFVMTDDSGDCKFCDYKIICERESIDEVVSDMFNSCTELKIFWEVRNHE